MECLRCAVSPLVHAFTTANLDKSLGRLKSEKIHNAIYILQAAMKNVCANCGTRSAKVDKAIAKVKAAWNENYLNLLKVVKATDDEKKAALDELQSAFQAVCLTCSRDSNDDNPSNHGQTFVSMDSGNCRSNSGKASTSATDDNVVLSRADWIGSHAAADYSPTEYGGDPSRNVMRKEEPEIAAADNSGCSLLPDEIEDLLRKEFANFAALDIIDKMLLSCVISGMNIAEFAKMLWLPYSIVNPQDNTIHSITKQAAHARWQNVIKKFPNFTAIACGQIGKLKGKQAAKDWLTDPNSEKPTDQFSNGKLTPLARKAAKIAADTALNDPQIPGLQITYSSSCTSIATESVRDSIARVRELSKSHRSRNNPNGDTQPDLLGEDWGSFDSSTEG